MTEVNIRHIQNSEDISLMLEWAQEEGWNPGIRDADAYVTGYSNDEFLMLEVDGSPAGCISLVRHSRDFAFIGLFIVKPEFRGQGYGRQLWDFTLRALEDIPSVGLYAVPALISRYESTGFSQNFENKRWQGASPEIRSQERDFLGTQLSDHRSTLFQETNEYDHGLVGFCREKYLEGLLSSEATFAIVTFDEDNKVDGYGFIRPGTDTYRVGPFYASTFESAKKIAEALITSTDSETGFVTDMPETNLFSRMFSEYFHLSPVSEVDTCAMFKGAAPEKFVESTERCYGLASLELG